MAFDRGLLGRRLRSHRLTAPAASVTGAARHMLAVQAQEFRGGRWALACRTRLRGGVTPTLSAVDAAFDRGELVRTWTMRGTIHIVPAADAAWLVQFTAARQLRQAASRHRDLGIDAATLRRAEQLLTAALAGGGRMTRAEVFAVLAAGGVPTDGQRGYHLLFALSVRGTIVQGPVVPRAGAPTREQCFVLAAEWLPAVAPPADPLTELFVRFIDGHGPAGAADFAWWAGLPLGDAHRAAEASGDRVAALGVGVYAARASPRARPDPPDVVALPAFDEYYLSYVDRAAVCPAGLSGVVGPGRNGMVRPILLERGAVAGVWSHSAAVGRHADDPVAEVSASARTEAGAVAAALARYARFMRG